MNGKALTWLLWLLLIGCAGKEHVIVLTPGDDGAVGALEVNSEGYRQVLDQEGQALHLRGRQAAFAPLSAAEARTLFAGALGVQPLPPRNFLLYFAFDSTALTEASTRLLDEILQAFREQEAAEVAVIGHSDRAGDAVYNLQLSLRRAAAVAELLVARGVPAAVIRVSSHGEGNPLVSTGDAVAEARNRRVEVEIR